MKEPTAPPTFSTWFPTFQRILTRWTSKWSQANPDLENSPLPEPLKSATNRFVTQSRWRRSASRTLAKTMLDYLAGQIERGVSPDSLAAQWSEVVPFPYLRRLQEPSLLAIHSLPPAVSELIVVVVRRTRLWRREQVDVARELISHFQDGSDAGLTASELVKEFGEPKAAAKLIGRAKRRNRPFLWRAAKRVGQCLALALAILVTWWLWLLIRFQFTSPTIVRDYIGQIDARSRALPESDRAWPYYAEALTKFIDMTSFPLSPEVEASLVPQWTGLGKWVDVVRIDQQVVQSWPVDENGVGAPQKTENVTREIQMDMAVYSTALDELSSGKHWPALVQFAEMNQEAVRLILQGSTKPSLGFIYRDPNNSTWLSNTNSGSFERFESATQSVLTEVLLPHMQHLRSFDRLLRIEAERARISGNQERVIEILAAYLRIAVQIDHADEFAIEKLIGQNFARRCWIIIRQILFAQPDFFAEPDLRTIAHLIAAYRTEVDLKVPLGTRQFSDDLLQRIYSDDGHGDGHLTADGWKVLTAQPPVSIPNPATGSSVSLTYLKGSLVSGFVATRHEARQLLEQLMKLEEHESNQPLWEIDFNETSAATELLRKTTSTISGRLKYGPLKSTFPFDEKRPFFNPSAFVLLGESSKMQCDATLVALALELYHRRNRKWPERLEQLCPDLLPTVPLDRFDGKAIKYQFVEGKPVLYSVGKNKIDDNGTWSNEATSGNESATGDWRLWPVWPSDS